MYYTYVPTGDEASPLISKFVVGLLVILMALLFQLQFAAGRSKGRAEIINIKHRI
jgi:hypothetical protein